MLAAPPPTPVYGWAGYSWNANAKAEAQFRVPSVNGATPGSIALWAGIGKGDPGIQQAGVTVTVAQNGKVTCTPWWEMWPAPPHPYGGACKTGDALKVTVLRSGSKYTLSVQNLSEGWHASTVQSYGHTEPGAEAIAEAYGPPVPQFAHLQFTTSGTNRAEYTMPHVHPVKAGGSSFQEKYT